MKNGTFKPTLLLVTFMFALLAVLAGCDRTGEQKPAGEAKKIIVAVGTWPASASVYIAHEKGYFREEGLDATLRNYPAGHLCLAALLSGKADFATSAETPLTRAALEGKPFAVVAIIADIDRAVLIIARKDRGIANVSDLRGKKIGLVAGTAAEFFLHIYLTTSYIDPGEVRVINLAPEKVVDALLTGEVDAVSTWSPYTGILQDKLGGNGVVLHESGLYTMQWIVTVTRDLPRRDPDVITRFLRAIVRANRFITEKPAEARAITAKNCGMEAAALEKEWGNFTMKAALEQPMILALEDQARWMIKKEALTRQTPNFLDFIYAKGLKEVQPETVRIAGE